MERLTGESGDGERDSLDDLFACLARGERRRVVGFALDRAPEPVPRGELARALAAWTHGKARADVTDGERAEAASALHHVHLPRLTAVGLLERDAEADAVTVGDHAALRDDGLVAVLAGDAGADPESIDALFRALADARRRAILDALSHQFGPIHLETLARELEVADGESAASEADGEAVDRALAALHHVDLPQLSTAGLIEYDAEARTVAYAGHPQLRVPWTHSVLQPGFRRSVTGESDPDGIGEIQGRERVISFGQSLCDRADEELFCMFTDTGLIEAGCLTRLRDAARERDVDVYLGTRDPTVREYVEANAPEVVLWEPNTDWLNLPVAGDSVGRLLLADREAVMLGTLLEETDEGVHAEQAIIGEGEHNTLVTMISQLLSPHLDEIDAGTEDVEARLPL